MYKYCIACGGPYAEMLLNGLKYRECKNCGLLWREEFDTDREYYENNEINLSELKIRERYANAVDRIKTFRQYVNLNNLCDIGTGEGIILKALRDYGYK